ncbi:hypothetical protein SDC9_145941 [bioreactor metagenome]|uniref:Uncharacterized protein n=1 Tax=bioreactor metagenome TaxID=1076179 RepID=A0A645EBP8_9ZZZZ
MTENFNFNQISGRSANVIFYDLIADFFDLGNRKLTAHHHGIREKRIEFYGFDVGDIDLGGNMDFHPDLPRIGNHRLIHCNYRG